MTLAEVKRRMYALGADSSVVAETIDRACQIDAYGTASIYAVVGDVYAAEVTILRITWCRRQVHGPPTPLHHRAQSIMWLGVTANQSP